jgi:hypothetical protein
MDLWIFSVGNSDFEFVQYDSGIDSLPHSSDEISGITIYC